MLFLTRQEWDRPINALLIFKYVQPSWLYMSIFARVGVLLRIRLVNDARHIRKRSSAPFRCYWSLCFDQLILRDLNSSIVEFQFAHIRRIHPPSWLLQFLLTVINEESIVVRHCWSLRVFSVQDQCQIHLAFFTHLGLVRWEIFRWICNAFSCRFDKTTGFLVFQLWPGNIISQTIEVTKQGFLILNVSINADSCFVFRKT